MEGKQPSPAITEHVYRAEDRVLSRPIGRNQGEGRKRRKEEGARNIGGTRSPSGSTRVPIGRAAHVRVGHNAVNRMMEKPPSIRAN